MVVTGQNVSSAARTQSNTQAAPGFGGGAPRGWRRWRKKVINSWERRRRRVGGRRLTPPTERTSSNEGCNRLQPNKAPTDWRTPNGDQNECQAQHSVVDLAGRSVIWTPDARPVIELDHIHKTYSMGDVDPRHSVAFR